MARKTKPALVGQPMRIQARPGSRAERAYYHGSGLPSGVWPLPEAVAPGVSPAPLADLMFHGGKIVPQMGFQNVFVGQASDWAPSDVARIDAAILSAMQDRRLNNVMAQYFPGAALTCDARPSIVQGEAKPVRMGEPEVQAAVIALFDAKRVDSGDLDRTIFNLVLPRGTVLTLDDSSSLDGLGGYHGSVHVRRAARTITIYYSANVFSERLSTTRENGIAVFDQSWKNVVATLYHELNEFRTDADVSDAIAKGDNDFLGWTSRSGQECGDQPIAAALQLVFREVMLETGARAPIQFMYSNAVHGAEGPIGEPH